MAIRIKSVQLNPQAKKRGEWWYSADMTDPFGSFLCRLCYLYRINHPGELPTESVIKSWDSVNKVYFPGAPKDVDRTRCGMCHISSTERRSIWCGPLQKIVCDKCNKEKRSQINDIVDQERERRGLPSLKIVCAKATCGKSLDPGERVKAGDKFYCKSCSETELSCENPTCQKLLARSNRNILGDKIYCKQCLPAFEKIAAEAGVLKPKPVPRPKGKPFAMSCEQCGKDKCKIKWHGPRLQDLCWACTDKARKGNLGPAPTPSTIESPKVADQ